RRLEPRLQVPHHAGDLLVARELASGGGRVHEEQVDVRREVELAAAELAEGEERRRRRARLLRRRGEGGGEAAVGEVGELAQARAEGPAQEVAAGDAQEAAVLRRLDRVPAGGRLRRVGRRRQRAFELLRQRSRELLPQRRLAQENAREGVARAEQ